MTLSYTIMTIQVKQLKDKKQNECKKGSPQKARSARIKRLENNWFYWRGSI